MTKKLRRAAAGRVCLCCKRADRPTFEWWGGHVRSGGPRILCQPCLEDPANAYADCLHGEYLNRHPLSTKED